MHKDEKWQVYHPNGEAIDGAGWNSGLGNPEITGSSVIVGVAVVFLYRRNQDGELEFLWQKRAENLDRYPGEWDISAGGHINLGESLVEGAVREVKEEIGVEVSADDLNFVTMRTFNKNRFAWIYAVDYTGRVNDFKFNDLEVTEVKWVKYSKMGDFRRDYAKTPLKKDNLTFEHLKVWLEIHGDI